MKKKLIITVLMPILFLGCTSNTTINKYNEVATEHQQISEQAFQEFSAGVELFNKQSYAEAANKGQQCYDDFSKAETLSKDAKALAEKMKDKSWLVDFKDLSAQAENLRVQQCQYLKDAANYSNNKDTEKAQQTISKISELNDKFSKLQVTMDDIKNQHPDSFK